MGEIADGLINGDFDFYTGEYIGRGYGIPRTLNKSLDWERGRDDSWKKVIGYMNNAGIKPNFHPSVVKAFGAPYPAKSPLRKACTHILKEFDKFKQFVNDNKHNFIT